MPEAGMLFGSAATVIGGMVVRPWAFWTSEPMTTTKALSIRKASEGESVAVWRSLGGGVISFGPHDRLKDLFGP
jgi:hypothetical protein